MTIKNAKEFPKRYFGLHFYPGTAEYREPGKDAYRIFVNEQTIKKMGPTFTGKPVYVKHVDQVNLENLQEEMDGLVVRSFYNKSDGNHWCEFIITSDRGHQAIRNGWKLSNAYHPTSLAPGGVHNGVEFDKEVMDGEYDHLAIVDDPRYEQSKILTPEDFKLYNEKKELEIQRLQNSKEKEPMLNFFKRSKVENSAELENTVVTLPKSKKEFTIIELVNQMDVIQNMQGYANGDHMVKMGDEEMSVNQMVKAFGKMKEQIAKNDQSEEKEPELANDKDGESVKDKETEKNESDEEKEPELANKKKKNAADKTVVAEVDADEEDEKTKKKAPGKNFNDIMNAADGKFDDEPNVIDLPHNMNARGKNRYGS